MKVVVNRVRFEEAIEEAPCHKLGLLYLLYWHFIAKAHSIISR